MSAVTPREFREALRDWLGNRVKFHPDWPRATTAGGFNARGIMHHWTGMGRNVSEARQVQVLRRGYAGLPGPLCHLAPTRRGDVWVIGWGNCNHAGLGDSRVHARVLAGRYDGRPQGSREDVDGNPVFYGFEYMFHPSDRPMPDEQHEAGVLAAAAISQAHGWGPSAAAGSNLDHYEWTDRKWDRKIDNLADRTRRDVRTALQRRIDTPRKDWFDMATEQDLRNAVARAPITVNAGGETVTWPLERVLRHLEQEQDKTQELLGRVLGLLDTEALAERVAARLTVDADAAVVKQAVKEALLEGVSTDA